MAKSQKIIADEKLYEKSELFRDNISSEMFFKSELISDLMTFDWLDEIELSCVYIDNIIRNPKVTLINEESVVKIEKAKKITVDSVKDLSRHTQFIDKIDAVTNEVQPSKILIVYPEETFNTYENRFVYTLIDNLNRFVEKKESLLESYESKSTKSLEYAASTTTDTERINVEIKIDANQLPKGKSEADFEDEIAAIRLRVKKIRDYLNSWFRSEMMKSLSKAHVAFIIPPIKRTNLILKNPNYQIAMRLWGFLQSYDDNHGDGSKEGLDTSGDNLLKGILNDSFLLDYFVLDSICSSKRKQKEQLTKYAIIMVRQQLQRIIEILLNSGITISDEEILSMISSEIKNQKSRILIGSTDVKKKFKSAIDEYLERTQDYL